MLLALPEVTLVCIDNVAQDLARLALRDTLRQITPAAVLLWTDGGGSEPEYDWIRAREFPFHEHGKQAADQPLWYEVPHQVETSHFLTVQWDGWVVDAGQWDPAFLDYDYIGAPWPWHPPGQNVGNGGFSLRSLRLAQFLAEHRKTFPYRYPEDDALGRLYRPMLERCGFRFAPYELAARFSFEHGHPPPPCSPPGPSFGFHDVRNWGWVLSDEEIAARLDAASAYVVNKTQLIAQMLKNRDTIRAIDHVKGGEAAR
jgi:hypothetical protein